MRRLLLLLTIVCLSGCHRNSPRLTASPPNPANNPYLAITDWYFSSTGNDSNSGTDSNHPLKTFAQVLSRLGPQPIAFTAASVTFHVLTSMASPTDNLSIDCGGTPAVLGVLGTPTTIQAGTLSGVVGLSRSGGLLPMASFPTWATSPRPYMIDTTQNLAAPLIEALTTGPYSGLTEMGATLAHQTCTTTCSTTPAEGTIANGDAYELVTPPIANILSFSNACAIGLSQISATLIISGNPINNQNTINESDVAVFQTYAPYQNYDDSGQFNIRVLNDSLGTGNILQGAWVIGGLLGSGQFSGNLVLDGDANIQNNTYYSNGRGCYGAFDSHHQLVVNAGAIIAPDSTCGYSNGYVSAGNETFWGETEGGQDLAQSLVVGGEFVYNAPATSIGFQGPNEPTFGIDSAIFSTGAVSSTRDLTINPSPIVDGLTLTREALDRSVASGGFGGYAFKRGNSTATLISLTNLQSTTQTGQCFGVVTGLDGGAAYQCVSPTASGQVLTYADGGFTWSAVNIDAGITFPISVPNGGTDDTSLTTHGVLLGEGTSAVSAVAPSASAYPLVSNASADPSYQQLPVASIVPGSNGQYLTTSGGAAAWGALNSSSVAIVTSSQTETSPSWANHAILFGFGGGGSGGSGASANTIAAGGGGGAGAWPSTQIVAVSPSTGYTVTIGAGGAAPGAVTNAPGNVGASGNATTFSTLATFPGGSGGAGGGTTAAQITAGGLPSTIIDFSPNNAYDISPSSAQTIGLTSTALSRFTGFAVGGGSNATAADYTDPGGPSIWGASGGSSGGFNGGNGGGGGGGGGGIGANGGAASATAPTNGASAAANSGAGGGGGGAATASTVSSGNGGAGGSGQLTIVWLP